jgi:hypothetical protein
MINIILKHLIGAMVVVFISSSLFSQAMSMGSRVLPSSYFDYRIEALMQINVRF